MPITSRGYRVALFLKVPEFDRSDLSGWPRASKSGNGYILRLAGSQRYFIHHSGKSDIVVLETDDKATRLSAVRELSTHLRAKDRKPVRATLEKTKALDLLRSLEDDDMVHEGKLHMYYSDIATLETDEGPEERIRTKIVFNNKGVDEAKKLSDDQEWQIRGAALTLTEKEKKHYGLIFFDAHPTARVVKVAMPMNDDLHEMLANRLVARL